MGFSSISDIGKTMVRILNDSLVPDVILHNGSIGLCSPDDHGDFNLGIYLYDVAPSEEVFAHGMVNTGLWEQVYPSSFLSLRYMITAYSNGDLKYRAEEDQRILGRVVQALADHSVIGQTSALHGDPMKTRIEQERIGPFEKIRLWTFPNEPYRLTLFYKVTPVEITSARTKAMTRVTDLSMLLGSDVENVLSEPIREIGYKRTLVVLCKDSTDDRVITGNNVRAFIEGERPAVIKEDGYRVFLNVRSDKATLKVESGIYEPYEMELDFSERDAEEVLTITLDRSKTHPKYTTGEEET